MFGTYKDLVQNTQQSTSGTIQAKTSQSRPGVKTTRKAVFVLKMAHAASGSCFFCMHDLLLSTCSYTSSPMILLQANRPVCFILLVWSKSNFLLTILTLCKILCMVTLASRGGALIFDHKSCKVSGAGFKTFLQALVFAKCYNMMTLFCTKPRGDSETPRTTA